MKKSIARPQAKISYELRGSGKPILLCHGLLSDGSFWDSVASQLENEYQLIIPDLRGHRNSSTEYPFTLWDAADDMLAILDQEKIESIPVIGFSMGGMTAMRMAIKDPKRISKLGLINTAACVEPFLPRTKNLALGKICRFTGPLKIFEPIVKKLMFSRKFMSEAPEKVEKELNCIRAQKGKSISFAIRAVFDRDDIVTDIEKIHVPTLVIGGGVDKTTPPRWSKEISEHIAGSELKIFPGVAHMSPTEVPHKISEELKRFL